MTSKITAEHLKRTAMVYVRQSTAGQVEDHPESRRRQYALAEVARELGFLNVEIIDEDLGVSGTGHSERPGFQKLLLAVSAGRVGAVLALEASRLARNDRDWLQVIELGALSSVVLIDHDGIYDPRLVNDRLLLGLKGIMSEFEIATLRQRAHEAVRAKARRGELRLQLPVGLTYGVNEAIEIEPDGRVQQAIRLLFSKFDELGSVRQVLLWLRREGLQVPVKRQIKGGFELDWAAPNYTRVHGVITNPLYAGAYVFGKTENRTRIVDGRAKRTSGHNKPMDRWEVLIQNHHAGYIDWQRYLRNVAMLEENAYMKPETGRKAARGGRSLLSGLLRCRRCGHTLQVGYRGSDNTVPAFRCSRRHQQRGSAWCVSFSGRRVEDAVAAQILEAVSGSAIEAALEAANRVSEQRLQQREALALELDQARYEATLASRRYDRVDPDMRLVAAELEMRWNMALERVKELEIRIVDFDCRQPDQERVDERLLRSLATNLPVVWNDEGTDMKLKQRIARILIREIVADIDEDSREIVLMIHWQGGRHTETRVAQSTRGRTQRCTDDEAIELVRRMSGRWSDHAIATQLNHLGWQTGTGKNWTDARVRSLRSRLKISASDTDGALLTCKEAATRLGISAQYLGMLLARGVVPGTQIAPGTPWWVDEKVLASAEVRTALAALRGRRPVKRTYGNRNLTIPGL